MTSSPESRFYFHAEGHAFSGQFNRPVVVPIPALASISLPTIGGHAHTRVENFDIPRLVSFKSAHTHVSGSQQDANTFTTQVTTTIEGLRILDFLTADRIVARLTSEHVRKNKEGHILAIGSNYENLRLGGHPVQVTLRHKLFIDCETFADLKKEITKGAKSGTIPSATNEAALCSLAEKIQTDLPGAELDGHVLHVPHFGSIAFAEVFAEPGTKTLTMLGLTLGSPDGGTATTAQTRINGTGFP
jgi:hypothetical protein